ncbi:MULTISPECIES: glycosyl hydrolase family 5 [Pseudomonas]|uniref:glycosyl hydrolase family 5 n=1 Tax=Pseudomonas sp. MIL9 TaxID=2807620 RepID=UPI001029BD21|nr:glycosyl hydrolase family 5 [Pseudomonas sp. MIL9]MBM6447116.1 glycosyl hydrolase family 5 [Pseudomonas sp. MIL9]RZO05828.1 glycosyl hydrolase family 5 [Pseudomonas moorei]
MIPLLRRSRILLAFLLFFAIWPLRTWASGWVASVDERNGLPTLMRGGSPAVTTTFSFFGRSWDWTYLQTEFKTNGPYRYTLAGKNTALDFDLNAQIQKQDPQSLTWKFALDARSMKSDLSGGGIVFNFDPSLFAGEMGPPALLPDNRGWSWGNAQGRRIEMRFEPALAGVYFEPGDQSEVRAFFYKNTIKPGRQEFTATLSVSGDVAIGPTSSERFGLTDPKSWPTDKLDWKTSPVDLSFLNAEEKPAGKRGFVKASGEQLLFADNTPARFWGTNLSAYTLFATPDDAIKLQAKRLSALGFNLVRLHHHDSPWVLPNIFGDSRITRSTQELSPQSLKKIDWWIKCLKDEGIYVWLDMHVQRALLEKDNIYGFDELPKEEQNFAYLKGYAYVNLTIQKAMKRFTEDYLTHVNPYTGLAYKDDPAIAAVLITNENDLTHHFGNALLPDKNVPKHNSVYMAEAKAFANQHNLSADQTWRSWEPGPSKLFLNDLERRFNVDMIEHLRGLGVKVPIATTSTWGGNSLNSLPALTVGDVIDVHSYGGAGQIEKNPLYSDGIVNWIAAGQVAGKPLTVTEWNNEPFPTPDRHSLPLYIAGTASHQGWDALMQYAYSQEPLGGEGMSASNWHAYNDPAMLATLPAAALLYRRADVHEATTTYVFAPTPGTLFNQMITPANSALLRTAMEKGKLEIAMPPTPELPWLQQSVIPSNAQVFHDPGQSLLDANANESTTDTGELKRNWKQGVYTINTPRTQAATGWIGGESISLGNIQVQVKTLNASVVVQSLDEAPLGRSQNLMISLGTRAIPQDNDKTPFYVEPLEGTLTLQAPQGLTLFTQGIMGQMKKLPATYADGHYKINFDGLQASNWLFLRKGDAKSNPVETAASPSSTRQ